MRKTLGILTQRPDMAVFYGRVLGELLGDYADIRTGAMEGGSIKELPRCDLYVSSVTSYDLLRETWNRERIPPGAQTVQMDLTFSRAAVDLLRTYPEGTKALLLNQNKHMTMESIAQLYHLGISNIEFYPCYPGVESRPETGLLFTVGERDLVPEGIAQVVDIGSRLPTANVICEIALKLGNAFFLEGERFRRYRSRLASVDYSLQKIISNSLTAENRLEMILNSLDEGIVCVDEHDAVTLINKTARRFLGVSRSEVLNRPVSEALPDLPFGAAPGPEESAASGPRLLNIRGTDFGAVTTPLCLQGQRLGSFVSLYGFHESERQQNALRRQKVRKGHVARHRFEDIVGVSPAILRAKDIARHMASNDAPVLLKGESGTGRALFAQAIHNASDRALEAFVTVNCAALSDEQLAAELFGYAAGCHPAYADGRTGLIECAHRGTLFLESIESMSPRFQESLLRMLWEGGVTRIGSEELIPVDLRLISSTDGELLSRVREGSFRRDLYYRLNVIPIHVPSLRERRGDLSALIGHFRRSLHAGFELTARAQLALLRHHWEGNVRELKNCMEYLKYMGLQVVDEEDLPEEIRASRERLNLRGELEKRGGIGMREYWVLRELGERYLSKKGMGRQALVERCAAHGSAISEHEVREALARLEELGYVEIRTGRGGSRLTENGYLQYRHILYSEPEEPAPD